MDQFRMVKVWLSIGVAVLLIGPGTAGAQVAASIGGTVADGTGAVLPGVTVEATSPALIEKVRTVVTDNNGQYKIVDLRPGTYAVTFTLSGFRTVRREGLALSTGFTAAVNVEMEVGSIEETVTVTGASPVVDTQNSRSQQVLKRETLDALPTGNRSMSTVAQLTLGAQATGVGNTDVGGDKGENANGIVIHGGRGGDGRYNYDGMSANSSFGSAGGQQRTYFFNQAAVEEMVVDTGGERRVGDRRCERQPCAKGGEQYLPFVR